MTDAPESARRLADSVWVILIARLVSIVGVPLAGFLFAQLWAGVERTNVMIQTITVRLATMDASVDGLRWRIEQIESEMRSLREPRRNRIEP